MGKGDPKEYRLWQANTFDMGDVLSAKFIEDMRRMEKEAPAHFQRFVMNSWEEAEDYDVLIPYSLIQSAKEPRFQDFHILQHSAGMITRQYTMSGGGNSKYE